MARSQRSGMKRFRRIGPARKKASSTCNGGEGNRYSFVFADRLEFLNAEHWDRVAEFGSVLVSREYLAALEAGGIVDSTMRYILIYRASNPVACVVTQTVDISGDQFVQSEEQSKIQRNQSDARALNRKKRLVRNVAHYTSQVKTKALGKLNRRITICGNLASWGMDGFAYDPAEPAQDIWQALCDGLYRLRRADKLFGQTDYVVVKDLPLAVRDESGAFEAHNYRAVETEPNMVLDLEPSWKCLDDYLASLTKKYRKAAKSVAKTLDKAEVELISIDDPSSRKTELYEMYQAVAARADMRLAALAPDFLPNLHANLGGDRFAIVALQSKEKKLLGYVTIIRDDNTAIGYYLGIDYQSSEELPIYHRLLFAVIEQALIWQCASISFGRTALDAKARLGCHPEPTFVWVRHRLPLLNVVVKQLLKAVPHAEPPERNPFKSESS